MPRSRYVTYALIWRMSTHALYVVTGSRCNKNEGNIKPTAVEMSNRPTFMTAFFANSMPAGEECSASSHQAQYLRSTRRRPKDAHRFSDLPIPQILSHETILYRFRMPGTCDVSLLPLDSTSKRESGNCRTGTVGRTEVKATFPASNNVVIESEAA